MSKIINHEGINKEFEALAKYLKKRELCIGDIRILLEAFLEYASTPPKRISKHDEDIEPNPIVG